MNCKLILRISVVLGFGLFMACAEKEVVVTGEAPFMTERLRGCELTDNKNQIWACKTMFGKLKLTKNCHRVVGLPDQFVCE